MKNPFVEARIQTLKDIRDLVAEKEIIDRFDLIGIIKWRFGATDKKAKDYITALAQAKQIRIDKDKVYLA